MSLTILNFCYLHLRFRFLVSLSTHDCRYLLTNVAIYLKFRCLLMSFTICSQVSLSTLEFRYLLSSSAICSRVSLSTLEFRCLLTSFAIYRRVSLSALEFRYPHWSLAVCPRVSLSAHKFRYLFSSFAIYFDPRCLRTAAGVDGVTLRW